LFGILFLFHFSVNLQQKKKEDFDIVKNIQIQEMKENLEKILSMMKQLGKDISDDIQKKVTESDDKIKVFNENVKNLEKELNTKFELIEKTRGEKSELGSTAKTKHSVKNKKEKFISVKKDTPEIAFGAEKKKGNSTPKTGHSISFSSNIVKQVYRMSDNNKTISHIVQETNLTRAEISLILNLRENRFTASN
jgi:hypothetical protein